MSNNNSDIFKYGNEVRSYDEYFLREGDLSKDLETEPLKVGSHQGALTIEVSANSAVSIATGANLYFIALECDTVDGEYTNFKGGLGVTVTASDGALEYEVGEKIATITLPNCKKYVKVGIVKVGTITGTIDIWKGYLAR